MKIFLIILFTIVAFFAANFTAHEIIKKNQQAERPQEVEKSDQTPLERLKSSNSYMNQVLDESSERNKKSLYWGSAAAFLTLIGSISFCIIKDKKKS